jgi:hypothetical protein
MDTSGLATFANDNGFFGPGPLGVATIVTRRAKLKTFPLDPNDFLTPGQASVSGLNGKAVLKVTSDYGVMQSLGTEVGRTSRGSPDKVRLYVAELNTLHGRPDFDLGAIERFWAERIQAYFDSEPLKVKLDASLSVRAVVRDILEQADKRQKAMRGTAVVGTVMQHLVGAKLESAIGHKIEIPHHSANASDQAGRGGDFDLGDSCVHVTAKPTDLLFAKCKRNLANGLKPIIVTAEGFTQSAQLQMDEDASRVDVLGIEQFVAANVHELGLFAAQTRATAIADIITRYNAIIDQYESNPSLKIVAQ